MVPSIIWSFVKVSSAPNTKFETIAETIEITNQMEDVKDIATFKTVEQSIQKYYNIGDEEERNSLAVSLEILQLHFAV